MGCDIHIIYQKQVDGVWTNLPDEGEFSDRWYDLFGFLAGVRRTEVEPISKPRGLPDDFERLDNEPNWEHSFSWLTIKELEEYDYSKIVKTYDMIVILGDYLGVSYFEELEKMKVRGVERIVFGFDS